MHNFGYAIRPYAVIKCIMTTSAVITYFMITYAKLLNIAIEKRYNATLDQFDSKTCMALSYASHSHGIAINLRNRIDKDWSFSI